jgi:hypothetical protein
VLALAGEMVQQPAVGRVAGPPTKEPVDRRAKALGLGSDGGGVQVPAVAGVAHRQGTLKDPAHRVRGAGLPPLGVADQLDAAAQQVRQAALVGGVGELPVRRPAITLDDPGIALAEDRGGILVATTWCDPVDGDLVADERPQPGPSPADPPAGLVGGDDRAGPDPIHQGAVGRRSPSARPRQRLDHPAWGERHPQVAEHPGDFGGGQAQPLGQPGGQRDRPRADLHPRRAQCIGGLLRMAWLDAPPAALAPADLQLVAGDHARLRRGQVLLVLAGHPFHRKLAAAVRAGRRQRHGDHPVHPLGDRPATVPPVGRTGLAPRPLGMGRGGVLGERRCLALGRPPQLLDLGGQLAHASLELLVGPLQPINLRVERGVLAFQPPKLLIQPTRATDPWIAPPLPQPARHKGRTLRHNRRPQPPANAIRSNETQPVLKGRGRKSLFMHGSQAGGGMSLQHRMRS